MIIFTITDNCSLDFYESYISTIVYENYIYNLKFIDLCLYFGGSMQ